MKIITGIILLILLAVHPGYASGLMQSGGEIAWDNKDGVIIEVLGLGVPPTDATSVLESRRLTKDSAIQNARCTLAKIINKVQVESGVTVNDLMTTNKAASTRLLNFINQTSPIKQHEYLDGTNVLLSVNMFGSEGLAPIILEAFAPNNLKSFPHPLPGFRQETNRLQDVYTGVIVDARNLKFNVNLLPKIYDTDGRLIYDYQYLDQILVMDKGITEYVKTPEHFLYAVTGHSRAGSRPLNVKALKVTDNGCNIVIGKDDADKMLAQNEKWGILSACAVCIAY